MRADGKRNVLGVGVDVIDYDAAVERVVQAARYGEPLSVAALAVHGVMTGALDEAFRARLNEFDLIAPDGQPVRWALNCLHGVALRQRVYGPELMLRVCQRAAIENLPIFLYGSTPAMLGRLSGSLLEKFPTLEIAGTQPSCFRPAAENQSPEVAEQIRSSGARIVFVGLGCPRQEVFVHAMCPQLRMPTLAVGAAFAFHSGVSRMAPSWMQDRGLEWLYRLSHEPRRLWRRYLFLNPAFVALVAAQRLGLGSFNSHPTRELDEA